MKKIKSYRPDRGDGDSVELGKRIAAEVSKAGDSTGDTAEGTVLSGSSNQGGDSGYLNVEVLKQLAIPEVTSKA